MSNNSDPGAIPGQYEHLIMSFDVAKGLSTQALAHVPLSLLYTTTCPKTHWVNSLAYRTRGFLDEGHG